MGSYILRRLFQSVVLLFFISAMIYAILNLVPGGPFDLVRGSNPRVTQTMIDRLNALLDLDKPIFPGQYCPVKAGVAQPCVLDAGRYLRWLGRVLQGDFGRSWTVQTGVAVSDIINYRLGYTLLLMIITQVLAFLIAVPVGVYSAVHQYSKTDYAVTGFAFFGQSMPTFWTGMLAMALFAVALGWFPTGGVKSNGMPGDILEGLANLFTMGAAHPDWASRTWEVIQDGVWHMALPASILIYFNLAGWIRFTRAAMLEVLRQDYMRTARSKGLIEQLVIRRHALRNALIPIITLLALTIPNLFGGAIITETIFSWPGMGRQLIDAINGVDWPVVQGILVITSAVIVFSNLLSDLLYAVVDPRIKLN